MRAIDWLTEPRRDLIIGAFAGTVASALGVMFAVWLVLSIVVGSAAIARWIAEGL